MGQNEMVAEYTESAHPYKQPAEVLHIAAETKNRTGYVLFPRVTKFNTWLLSRYGKRIEAELAEGIMAGEYAAAMRLYDVTAAHISCRFSPRMSLWRVNRYEFIADVPVEISWESSAGEETAEGYVSLNCCLDENFCYFIDGVSLEKPDRPLIRLDEYLIPIMSYEDLEAAARAMWEQYLPKVFTDREWLNPYRLAEHMGLKVTFHLLYRRKKKRGLLFWKDGTVKVVTHTDRNDLIEEVKIEAGTIVIRTHSVRKSRSGGKYIAIGVKHSEKGAYYANPVEKGHGGPAPAPAHPFVRPAFDVRKDEAYQIMKNILKDELLK